MPFFFSSRRRHTSSKRDWSSDVCSSDLLPTGYSQTPGASSAGMSAIGQGGADFAGRYPWYVDAVRNRVQQSWDQTTIDPATRAAHRAHTAMTFRINSNGTISHIRLLQRSGN